jgi:hypothetical protein
MDRTCPKCNKSFAKPCLLRAHLKRKTTCAPITKPSDLPEADQQKEHPCKFCGRRFASQISKCRHVRQNCKVANGDGEKEEKGRRMGSTAQMQIMERLENLAALVAQLAAGPVVPPVRAEGITNIEQQNDTSAADVRPCGDAPPDQINALLDLISAASAENSDMND